MHSGSHRMAGASEHLRISLDGPNCLCYRRGCPAMYIGPAPLSTPRLGPLRRDQVRRSGAGRAGPAGACGRCGRGRRARSRRARARCRRPRRVRCHRRRGDHSRRLFVTSAEWLRPGLDARLAGRRASAPDMLPLITLGVLGAEATSRGGFQTCRDAPLDDPTSVPLAPPAPVATPLP
ncbi:hypothetical protein N7U49_04285 [Streptomyces sp. AD2-2]|nr:hypothetical protein N7U49_04285 [Streptomyces sp. AD2-2]